VLTGEIGWEAPSVLEADMYDIFGWGLLALVCFFLFSIGRGIGWLVPRVIHFVGRGLIGYALGWIANFALAIASFLAAGSAWNSWRALVALPSSDAKSWGLFAGAFLLPAIFVGVSIGLGILFATLFRYPDRRSADEA
jgi:hypothetical protein